MGGDRKLNEALNQALKLEAAKAVTGPPAGLRKLTAVTYRANQPADRRRKGWPLCWQCGFTGHLRIDCRRGPREGDQPRPRINAGEERGPTATSL
jgi:hypothetical protein